MRALIHTFLCRVVGDNDGKTLYLEELRCFTSTFSMALAA